MTFHRKLDLLMKVQGTTNSRLARALSIDPSLVSRWRTGARKPAKNGNYLKEIANFFSTQARMDYQKAALFEIMGIEFNKDQKKLYSISDLLYNWFSDNASLDQQFIEAFFSRLNEVNQISINTSLENNNSYKTSPQKDIEILYGIEGKRSGVIKFLTAVLEQNQPRTLMLYSDEDMEWLTGDHNFLKTWNSLLKKVLIKGNKIKIIHTIKRELSEILAAVRYWLPLYMTGSIEPYYYPKYQEHIFKRTMFIAPETAALTASTVSEYSPRAEQLFYTDKAKIKNLVDEYNTFLSMCRPLMRIFTGDDTHNFHIMQLEFDQQPGNVTTLSDMFSSVTISNSLMNKITTRSIEDDELKNAVNNIQNKRNKYFKNNLEKYTYTELIKLPEISAIKHQNRTLKPHDFFNKANLNYTPADFYHHIENIIYLLNEYSNYKVFLSEHVPTSNLYLTSKEEVGVIVARNNDKPVIFAFNQLNMINTFNVYLKEITKRIHKKERKKNYIINRLSTYKERFKDEFQL